VHADRRTIETEALACRQPSQGAVLRRSRRRPSGHCR